MVAYNNYGLGIGTLSNSDYIYIENIISSNNYRGISIQAGTSNQNSQKQLQNSIIIGQNPDNPICQPRAFCQNEECKQ